MQSNQHRCLVKHWELKSIQNSCKISLSLSNQFILSDTKQKNDMTDTDSAPHQWQNTAVPVSWIKGKSNQEWSIRPAATTNPVAFCINCLWQSFEISLQRRAQQHNRAAAAERGSEMNMRGKSELVIWEKMRGEESTRWAENRFFTISVCEITMSAELQ